MTYNVLKIPAEMNTEHSETGSSASGARYAPRGVSSGHGQQSDESQTSWEAAESPVIHDTSYLIGYNAYDIISSLALPSIHSLPGLMPPP